MFPERKCTDVQLNEIESYYSTFCCFLVEKEHELNTGVFVDRSSDTVESFILQWLKDKRSQVRPTTFRSYEWLVKRIVSEVGKYRIYELKPMHLQRMYTMFQTSDKPLSNRSILHAHMIVHQVLERAVRWNLIPRIVADLVDPPKPRNVEMAVWDEETTRRFLSIAMNDAYYIVFVLAIFTFRKSEFNAVTGVY
jgi:integrase